MARLAAENTIALVIDLQEKIVPAMSNPETLLARSNFLIRGLRVFEIPIVSTRQYPKGLGDSVAEIKVALGDAKVFDKIVFSCLDAPEIRNYFAQDSRPNVLLAGIETHICVLQTALDLVELGKRVYLVRDCVSSRSPLDTEVALQRLWNSGVVPTTAEAALFEIARVSGTPQFKSLSKLATGR